MAFFHQFFRGTVPSTISPTSRNYQCCRAGAARSSIILVEPKPVSEPQRDAAPAPAPNLMFNVGRLLKMAQTKTVFYFSHSHF
jgi:hypothetical protein